MPKVLTKKQISDYHQLGFIAPIDVMSEDEALDYKQQLEAAERRYPHLVNPEKRNNAHLSIKCLDELAHHPRILDAVEDLIGSNIALWASVLFIKEPNSSHFVSWHQDATYMAMSDNNFVTPWLALSPSNRETGCMSMIPRSHKNHIQSHVDTFGDDNILTRGQEVQNVNTSEKVDLILRPGQMSLHHGEVIHASQPNCSSQRRIGFALQSFMPPHIKQTVGHNYWLNVRGENLRTNSYNLTRPEYDADPVAHQDRILADANLADILYSDAQQRRSY